MSNGERIYLKAACKHFFQVGSDEVVVAQNATTAADEQSDIVELEKIAESSKSLSKRGKNE